MDVDGHFDVLGLGVGDDLDIVQEEEYNDDDEQDVLGPCVDKNENHAESQPVCVPGPTDLSQSPDDGPTQLHSRNYPSHSIGNVQRRFNYKWFGLYSWLEYSTVTDSAYCFCCRHFLLPANIQKYSDAFTQTGFRAWNRCVGSDPKTNAFLIHKNSDEHREAVSRQDAYRSMAATEKTVVDMLDAGHRKQVRLSSTYDFMYFS